MNGWIVGCLVNIFLLKRLEIVDIEVDFPSKFKHGDSMCVWKENIFQENGWGEFYFHIPYKGRLRVDFVFIRKGFYCYYCFLTAITGGHTEWDSHKGRRIWIWISSGSTLLWRQTGKFISGSGSGSGYGSCSILIVFSCFWVYWNDVCGPKTG